MFTPKTAVRVSRFLIVLGMVTVCQPNAFPQATGSHGYFKTPFQSESQFIIESIVSDLAEQMFFAANHQLPDKENFSVTARGKPGSPVDAPVYEVEVNLDKKHASLKLEVNVNGPIWSPKVYLDVAAALARTAGLSNGPRNKSSNTNFLSKLLDGKAETIERENQSLSSALEKNFTDPELHEQAALLLGAFALREHSGNFYEIRAPLSRMTAHLTMASFLRGTNSPGINGQLAKATLLTLLNNETQALEALKSTDTNDPAVTRMARVLRAINTGDYRPLSAIPDRSQMESVVCFSTMADAVDVSDAWVKLDEAQQQTIDFARAANERDYSVEMGHALLQEAIPLELEEITNIYELSQHKEFINVYELALHKELSMAKVVAALNELPERNFNTGPGKETHVRIIGWGQWAMFFQRHLCHAVQQNFYFMNWDWGVPDDAKDFAAKCGEQFGGLRLYPFVRRFNCTDEAEYHKSVDDGLKVTVATPQLVPAECWRFIVNKPPFAPAYRPYPNMHINEWHDHNPPAGTVYNLEPRLNRPDLTHRRDVLARFEQLHEMAPYDVQIANTIIKRKYHNHATFDQAKELFQGLLPYSVAALRAVANTVAAKPNEYEKYMRQAAELDPARYYDLADYCLRHNQQKKAAQNFDKACDKDPDAVRVSNYAEWRVRYYLKNGQSEKARAIADSAAEVYSYGGLKAKAVFMEETTNYDGAFECLARIEERYNDSSPLIAFCLHYKARTGDTRFDAELQKRKKALFPKGVEKVSFEDFHAPPTDGVLIQLPDNRLSSGLNQGDIIVAINGVRVHAFNQYCYIRDTKHPPRLDLIVWQGDAYHKIKANPPKDLGVDFSANPPQKTPDQEQ